MKGGAFDLKQRNIIFAPAMLKSNINVEHDGDSTYS
jgi:hypothetical protein